MDPYASFVKAPNIISVILDSRCKITIDKTIKIMNQNGRNTILYLKGLIYFGNFHFVARVITSDKRIWYNDGRSMGRVSTLDGTLRSESNENLWERGSNILAAAIYAQT